MNTNVNVRAGNRNWQPAKRLTTRGAPALLSGADGEAIQHEEADLSRLSQAELAEFEQIVTSAAQTAGQK